MSPFMSKRWGAIMRLLVVASAIAALGLQGCGQPASDDISEEAPVIYSEAPTQSASVWEQQPAPDALPSYETPYQDAGSPYGCTDDCSGHEAGYAWAQDNGIENPDDCGGNSNSFIEGCMTYAEEYQEEQEAEGRRGDYW